MVEGHRAVRSSAPDALSGTQRFTLQHIQAKSGYTASLPNDFTTALQRELEKVSYSDQVHSADPAEFPKVSAEETQEIVDTAKQMESLILFQLLKQMWDTIPEGTLFTAGPAEKMYREMWLEQMAGNMVQQDSVLGLADMVQSEMLDKANRTVEPAELAPDLGALQQQVKVDRVRSVNPYGYLSGATPGF
jgi:Rod binding domain-containing protein